MFSLTDRAKNILLSRTINEEIDEYVLKLFVEKNKHQAEFAFFKNDLICSWCAKGKSDSLNSEILYILFEKNRELDEPIINDIFKESACLFKIPDYSEYVQYMQHFLDRSDIIKNIIDYLSDSLKRLLTKEEYEMQAELVLKTAGRPFKRGIHFNSDYAFSSSKKPWKDEKINIEETKLAFMGSYCFSKVDGSLRKLLAYKILEKIYGTNEVDSVYFPLRCEGKIYTAISSYVMHKEIFLTGVLADYKESLLHQTLKLAQDIHITDEIFLSAKRRLIDDIKFIAFQYGHTFALLSYIYTLKREIEMPEIFKAIMEITLEDIKSLASQDMRVIVMGVNT